MRSQFTWLAMLISSSLFSCSSNPSPDPTPPEPDKMPLTIQGGIAPYTKASDAGFDNGDAVGIYVVDYSNPTTPGVLQVSGNHATNNKHIYNTSDNSWKPDAGKQIYWNDETTKVDIYGCYPYHEGTAVQYSASVQADQSTPANYAASDFMWAKKAGVAPQTTPIPLDFGHKMSKLVITLIAGDGFTSDEFAAASKAVRLYGVNLKAEINIATGEASVKDNYSVVEAITPYQDGNAYKAIIAPQTIPANGLTIEAMVNGISYISQTAFSFISNKQHNLEITINKQEKSPAEMNFTANRVTPWEPDNILHTATAYLQSERNALMALYNATNGDQWKVRTGWGTLQPLDQWHGVTTDAGGHVIKLELNDNQLVGSIPASIAQLSQLSRLNLQDNQLSGELPIEISNMTHLQSISLGNNQLSGTIPASIWLMPSLTSIFIQNNRFTGDIPEEARNKYYWTTQISPPSEVVFPQQEGYGFNSKTATDNVAERNALIAFYNAIGKDNWGGRSDNWCSAKPLEEWYGVGVNSKGVNRIYLAYRGLAGDLSVAATKFADALTDYSVLWFFDCRGNQMTGGFPTALARFPNLEYLRISGNRLAGIISRDIQNHPYWSKWSYNSQQVGYGFTLTN